MRMLWKCMISASNHCEVDRQLSQDLFNAIIYSAGRGRRWIIGTGVCRNSMESATPTNRKLHWLDSWALWVFDVRFRRRCTSAHFAVALPPAVTGGWERELVKVRRDLRRNILTFTGGGGEWERWAIWKSNCKNRFLENFIHNITILLNYYVRYFFVRIWQPYHVWSVVCKPCLLTNAWRFFADLFTYTDQVNNKCCFKLQHAYYYQLSLRQLRPLCRRSLFCTAAISPVSLVFALHMIKIWNRKNWNRTVNHSFFVKTDRNQPQIHKWKPSQHYKAAR